MKAMMEAKKHIDALKMIAEREGMSVDDLMEQLSGEEESEEMESEDMGEEEKGMGPDKGKIALIIAKMKNGQKD
jgi:hypothetical protein